MPWKQQGGGGPWGGGGGGGGGPWGGGGGGGGPQSPDFEEFLRKGQDKVRRVFPGGIGNAKGLMIIVALAVVVWLATGFYRVQPNEVGVPLVFGQMTGKAPPGLNWNWPTPIGSVELPQVTNINEVEIGFRSVGRSTARRQVRNVPEEGLMLTGDENIIDIQVAVFWKIDDRERTMKRTVVKDGKDEVVEETIDGIRQFLFNIRNPEETVKAAAEAAMREIIGKSEFEFARTQGRVPIEQESKKLIQSILDDYGAGIEVTDVQMQKIDPPGKVLDAFRDVQAARADKERAINVATAYFNEKKERAEGEAQQILRAAEGYKEAKIKRAEGEADRFLSLYKEYKDQTFVTRRRIYLETMREVLGGMDKILIDSSAGGSGVVPYLPLNELRKNRNGNASPGNTTNAGAAR